MHTTISFDGFIAGPSDEMDWVFEYDSGGPTDLVDEIIATTGAILAGRRSYEVGRRAHRPEVSEPFGGAWSGPEFVLTHDPPDDEQDRSITFLSGDIGAAVDTALEAAGGKGVLIFGADVANQCLDEGLVDEIVIHVAPVLLGNGVRLFAARPDRRIELQPISVSRSGTVTILRYGVMK